MKKTFKDYLTNKWLIATASVIIVSGGLVGYGVLRQDPLATMAQAATATVTQGNIQVHVTGTGTIISAAKASLKASEESKIKTVHVAQGQSVKKGQVLIDFVGKDLSDQIEQEQFNLDRKNLDLQDLQQQAAANTNKDFTINMKKLQLDIQQSNSKIASLQEQQAASDAIVAPFDGVIVLKNANVGDQVTPKDELIQIADPNNLQMIVSVDELDITKIKNGQQANVQADALPDQKLTGEVVEIAAEGKAQNGVSTFDVTLKVAAKQAIKPGMTAHADVLIEQKQNVLLLPVEAVQDMQGKHFVMLPTDNGANEKPAARDTSGGQTRNKQMKPVEVGIHNETYFEITGGLTVGEKVALPTIIRNSQTNNMRGAFGGMGGGGGMRSGGAAGGKASEGGNGGKE